MEVSYSVAFIAGLLGSGHCIGMCGGLASAFFMTMGPAAGPLTYGAYHGARLGVYTLAGAAAGALGLLLSAGFIGKAQGILQIVAGGLVILLGLDIFGVGPLRRIGISLLPSRLVGRALSGAQRHHPITGALIAGTLNGFMPCSLTLAMAVKATTVGGPLSGALLMLAFGFGTLPSMVGISYLLARLGVKARGHLLQIAALFVIGLGVATLYQGVAFFQVMKGLANW